MLRRIVLAAALAGVLAGILLTAIQQIEVIPILLEAEGYEAAAFSMFQSTLAEKITIDQSGANTAAIEALVEEAGQKIEICQNKYLNNLVEQDHRAVKVSIENLEQPCVVAANLSIR